ncbi:unnamed protein product [Heligmosomoides polygyrus]|uniref:AAA_12 domain-containing protein n=1 Tax=Heligmosomoides polygyrus TaxID=6339 RepID=A0A183GVQ2_HELPZ|nr:unnamed protein product [Heligmosomoides polygyrus]
MTRVQKTLLGRQTLAMVSIAVSRECTPHRAYTQWPDPSKFPFEFEFPASTGINVRGRALSIRCGNACGRRGQRKKLFEPLPAQGLSPCAGSGSGFPGRLPSKPTADVPEILQNPLAQRALDSAINFERPPRIEDVRHSVAGLNMAIIGRHVETPQIHTLVVCGREPAEQRANHPRRERITHIYNQAAVFGTDKTVVGACIAARQAGGSRIIVTATTNAAVAQITDNILSVDAFADLPLHR